MIRVPLLAVGTCAVLAVAPACTRVPFGTPQNALACARSEDASATALLSARILSDSSGDPLSRDARRPWGITGASASEMRAITDDAVCSRILRVLRAELRTSADSVAVVRVRDTFIVLPRPATGTTFVLDHKFRLLDVLVVPS